MIDSNFHRTSETTRPSQDMLTALGVLLARQESIRPTADYATALGLYSDSYQGPRMHQESTREQMRVGIFTSKNSRLRDQVAEESDGLGVEMEAAGLMGVMSTVAVRGILEDADSDNHNE